MREAGVFHRDMGKLAGTGGKMAAFIGNRWMNPGCG